jgi:hypothetical protein
MEEWMQQQGRNRSYSMSYADNISFYQQQLQHKQRAQHQPPLAPPQHQSFPPGMDSFLQEGSPSSMSSCGSDDAAYSSDTVVTDYTPLHQLSQHHALEHQALPAQLQRRASLSSTPVSAVAGSLSILGGFVGEGLRAEYASRRPGGRRKSICLSPSENEQQMNHPGGADDGLTPDSEMPEQIEAMRRNSLYAPPQSPLHHSPADQQPPTSGTGTNGNRIISSVFLSWSQFPDQFSVDFPL